MSALSPADRATRRSNSPPGAHVPDAFESQIDAADAAVCTSIFTDRVLNLMMLYRFLNILRLSVLIEQPLSLGWIRKILIPSKVQEATMLSFRQLIHWSGRLYVRFFPRSLFSHAVSTDSRDGSGGCCLQRDSQS